VINGVAPRPTRELSVLIWDGGLDDCCETHEFLVEIIAAKSAKSTYTFEQGLMVFLPPLWRFIDRWKII
jgi:hypothetical protein